MTMLKNIILRIIFSATPLCLAAAEPRPIEAFVAEALAGNPELKFYEAEIAAARGQQRQSGTFANPELSAELGSKRVNDLSGNRLGDGAVWSVSIAQTFEFPGRVSLRKAIASRQVALAELGLEQFRAALAMRVRLLAFKLLAAQERADAARAVSQRFQDLLAVLVQRDPAGVAPLLDTRIIEASTLSLNRRAAEAERELLNARFELNQLRGEPVRSDVAVKRTPLVLKPGPALELLLASTRERNFDVRTRTAELEQQGFQVKLSQNERWPSVTVAPYFAGEHASDRQREFGLGVTIPLPLWNQNKGNIETTKARQAQAEVSLTVALREAEREVAAATHAYEVQLAEMAKWPADAATRFAEAAKLADQHYRLGAVPISTYLELQTQYLDSVDTMLSTQLDALEARQRVELLAGMTLDGHVPPDRETVRTASAATTSTRRTSK